MYKKYLAMKFKYKGTDILSSDCYGGCKIIAKDRGILLPDINYNKLHMRQATLLIKKEMIKTKVWEKVPPQKDTLVAFRINGTVSHVGYMISDSEFWHIQKETDASIESIHHPLWSTLMVGCYKYIGK